MEEPTDLDSLANVLLRGDSLRTSGPFRRSEPNLFSRERSAVRDGTRIDDAALDGEGESAQVARMLAHALRVEDGTSMPRPMLEESTEWCLLEVSAHTGDTCGSHRSFRHRDRSRTALAEGTKVEPVLSLLRAVFGLWAASSGT